MRLTYCTKQGELPETKFIFPLKIKLSIFVVLIFFFKMENQKQNL